MAIIELPPNISLKGIALAREIAELIGRHFPETNEEPNTKPSSTRDAESDSGDSGNRVCPKCGVGSVVRRNRSSGGAFLVCTENKYQDDTTCQFIIWNKEDQDNFLAGKVIKDKPVRAARKPSTTAQTAMGTPDAKLVLASAVVKQVRELGEVPARLAALSKVGFPDDGKTSYVQWIYNLDDAQLRKLQADLVPF